MKKLSISKLHILVFLFCYTIGAQQLDNVVIKDNLTKTDSSIVFNYKNNNLYYTKLLASNFQYWTRQNGAIQGYVYGYGIAADIDDSPHIYVTGYTTVGLSGQKQNGVNDYYLAKYDYDGNFLWLKQVGASGGNTYGYGVVSKNAAGNVYVVGYTSVGISKQRQRGSTDYYIAKYDTYGNLIWSRQEGNKNGDTYGYAVTEDNNGYVYVVGTTTANISGEQPDNNNDYFIAKYDAAGNRKWTQQFSAMVNIKGSGNGIASAQGVSADINGNVYVAGSVTGWLSGQSESFPGGENYFLTKFDVNGNLMWTQQVGSGNGITQATSVSVDPNDPSYIYVAGKTRVGISGQIQNGWEDYFIARYDSNGNLYWTKQVGNTNGDFATFTDANGVSVANNGKIYIAGLTNVGISGQTQNGYVDYFIAQYDRSGNLAWTTQVGALDGNTYGYGISTDYLSNSYVAGNTDRPISGQVQNGLQDYFLAQYRVN